MKSKAKGSNAERQLMHLFWEHNFAAARIAGSGSTQKPAADLIVGNPEKKYVIECKVTKNDYKYFDHEEVQQLILFAEKFGAEPLVAVRFHRTEWLFLKPDQLKETGKFWVIKKSKAETEGKTIEQL